jgi:hypothetical protein
MNFLYWEKYFIDNSSHFDEIEWELQSPLSDKEIELITTSIQQFQKGEQSEGKHLFSFAKTFPYPCYLETMRLFILEEQTHARVLGKFMDKEGIARIRGHWVDDIFRWLRKLINLENTITVLVTAEIIAKIYYKALKESTASVVLRQLCDQILKDEDQHINFQSFTLNIFYQQKGKFRRFLSRSFHSILMVGTILIVWIHHRRVLKGGGYDFIRFFLETSLVFLDADKLIKKTDHMHVAFA